MQNFPSNRVVRPSVTTNHRPRRVVTTVKPNVTINNTQQSESNLLALLVGIALGVAGALAAMERAKRGR